MFCVYCACLCVRVLAWPCHGPCIESNQKMRGSWFLPSTLWILRITLRSPCLVASVYILSRHTWLRSPTNKNVYSSLWKYSCFDMRVSLKFEEINASLSLASHLLKSLFFCCLFILMWIYHFWVSLIHLSACFVIFPLYFLPTTCLPAIIPISLLLNCCQSAFNWHIDFLGEVQWFWSSKEADVDWQG